VVTLARDVNKAKGARLDVAGQRVRAVLLGQLSPRAQNIAQDRFEPVPSLRPAVREQAGHLVVGEDVRHAERVAHDGGRMGHGGGIVARRAPAVNAAIQPCGWTGYTETEPEKAP